ncbi:cysteine dioxygenase [Vallicoccus soli]|uniref:Cysteine dioxygenase n=1 Tax=Vallicoccus soli TaxID=2339232 RepID=A0A3A3Z1W4_9ACTN|nr:cysteine dioxygenase family protein [Vallicoccus soli]RJK95458.1 cysteine dioxygenase [Vallicoccus soli]
MTALDPGPSLGAALPHGPGAPSPADLSRLVRRLAAEQDLWRGAVRYDPDHRHYARVATGTGYEAWLLTWLPGQSTGLHDHGGSAGAFTVLRGALRELSPRADGLRTRLRERVLQTAAVRTFGPDHLHDVAALDGPAVSLHLYGPALTTMTRYALVDGVLRVTAREGAGSDW